MWPILSLTKLPTVLVTKRFNQKADYEEPIQVVQEFDPQLKFVTFIYINVPNTCGSCLGKLKYF